MLHSTQVLITETQHNGRKSSFHSSTASLLGSLTALQAPHQTFGPQRCSQTSNHHIAALRISCTSSAANRYEARMRVSISCHGAIQRRATTRELGPSSRMGLAMTVRSPRPHPASLLVVCRECYVYTTAMIEDSASSPSDKMLDTISDDYCLGL